jgi:hypothetical protein
MTNRFGRANPAPTKTTSDVLFLRISFSRTQKKPIEAKIYARISHFKGANSRGPLADWAILGHLFGKTPFSDDENAVS